MSQRSGNSHSREIKTGDLSLSSQNSVEWLVSQLDKLTTEANLGIPQTLETDLEDLFTDFEDHNSSDQNTMRASMEEAEAEKIAAEVIKVCEDGDMEMIDMDNEMNLSLQNSHVSNHAFRFERVPYAPRTDTFWFEMLQEMEVVDVTEIEIDAWGWIGRQSEWVQASVMKQFEEVGARGAQ